MKIDTRNQYVIGVIDSYGCVHSRVIDISNSYSHHDLWPYKTFRKWSWYGERVEVSVYSDSFDVEEIDKVKRHLERKYSISGE